MCSANLLIFWIHYILLVFDVSTQSPLSSEDSDLFVHFRKCLQSAWRWSTSGRRLLHRLVSRLHACKAWEKEPKTHLSEAENIWLPFKEQIWLKHLLFLAFGPSCCTLLETLVFRFFFQFKTGATLFIHGDQICLAESLSVRGCLRGGVCEIFSVLKGVGRCAAQTGTMVNSDWTETCVCGIVFADAQDKELLAQCNITHILSIHDTAAPVLAVSSPLLNLRDPRCLALKCPRRPASRSAARPRCAVNWLTCCTDGNQLLSDGLLRAGPRPPVCLLHLLTYLLDEVTWDAFKATRVKGIARGGAARLQSKALKSTTSRGVKVTSSYFSFAQKVLKGGIYPASPAGRLDTGRNPGDFLSARRDWTCQEEASQELFVSHEMIKELQLEVHLVLKLEPHTWKKKGFWLVLWPNLDLIICV